MRRTFGTRAFVAVLLACAGLFGFAAPALAHDELVGSDPANGATVTAVPAVVHLYFEEPPVAGYTTVSVRDPGGTELRTGPVISAGATISVHLRRANVRGSYRVAYHVLSDDGHPVDGTVLFTLGTPASASRPADTAASRAHGSSLAPYAIGIGAITLALALGGLTTRRRVSRRRAVLTGRAR